jgi:hypothetical protein
MAMEVAWTRAFAPEMFQALYDFAFILIAYLFGNAIGVLLYRIGIDRARVLRLPTIMAIVAITSFLPLIPSCEQQLPSISADEFMQRMPDKAKADAQEWTQSTDPELEMKTRISTLLSREVPISQYLLPNSDLAITDDHPRNEYFMLSRNLSAQ